MATTTPAEKRWGFGFGCDGTLSRQEAAEFLGVHARTIDRLYRLGRIRKGKNLLGQVRICKRSLEPLTQVSEI